MERLKGKSLVFGFYKFLLLAVLMTVLHAGEKKMNIYDFNVKTIDGKEISMEQYRGKVLLIVNVASKCGFTEQYEGLEALYEKYNKEGFMVLGFPSNQFLSQEPESNAKIKVFCQATYDVKFDMFAKIDVNGENADPLYKFLKKEQGGFLWMDSIKWNFTKFLVDREGNIVARYGSATKPLALVEDIEKLCCFKLK